MDSFFIQSILLFIVIMASISLMTFMIHDIDEMEYEDKYGDLSHNGNKGEESLYGKERGDEEELKIPYPSDSAPNIKAGFSVTETVEKMLKDCNCKYSTDRFKKLYVFSFNYQSGHFYISCKDNHPFIEIVYPSIYKSELAELNLIRRNCNKVNGMWTMVRAFYDINGEKNRITVELRATLLVGKDKKRNAEAMSETFSTLFNYSNDFFLWINSEKDISKKVYADDIDLYIAHNDRFDTIIAEQEIKNQDKRLPFRPNTTRKLTLGQMLDTFLDMEKPDYNRLQVVSDNGKTMTIDNAEEIGNFDILEPFAGNPSDSENKPAEFVTLNVSLNSPEQKGHPIEYEKARKSVLTLIMNKVSADETTAYIRTVLVSTSVRPLSQYHNAHGDNGYKTILVPLDYGDSKKKLAEFNYLLLDAQDKVAEGKASTLSDKQKIILEGKDRETAYCLYWGTAYFEEKLYYAALLLLENAWTTLNADYAHMNKDERERFYHVCFLIGFCYTELGLYKKAFFYLNALFPLNNFQYTREYVNCLANSKDFRAINIINVLMGQLELAESLSQEEPNEMHRSFYNFLKRRKGFVLIDLGKLDEAENLFIDMLDEPQNIDYALGELAHIRRIRSNKIVEGDE